MPDTFQLGVEPISPLHCIFASQFSLDLVQSALDGTQYMLCKFRKRILLLNILYYIFLATHVSPRISDHAKTCSSYAYTDRVVKIKCYLSFYWSGDQEISFVSKSDATSPLVDSPLIRMVQG